MSYTKARDQKIADEFIKPEDELLECTFCHRPTKRGTLSAYGARCFPCYEAYGNEPQSYPDTGDKGQDPRGWARALKRREDSGERLTPAQRAMCRSAIGVAA